MMSSIDDDGPSATRARQPLAELRRSLREVRGADDAGRLHAALIDVVDGLIAHVERQARAVEDLRSDLGHKQGIVTNIGGGTFRESAEDDGSREFAASANGDRWSLARHAATGIAHVIHRANLPSGGAVTSIELGVFLDRAPSAPETLGLLQLIGTLVP